MARSTELANTTQNNRCKSECNFREEISIYRNILDLHVSIISQGYERVELRKRGVNTNVHGWCRGKRILPTKVTAKNKKSLDKRPNFLLLHLRGGMERRTN